MDRVPWVRSCLFLHGAQVECLSDHPSAAAGAAPFEIAWETGDLAGRYWLFKAAQVLKLNIPAIGIPGSQLCLRVGTR